MSKEVIQFFKECYEEENSNKSLWNIFSSKFENLAIFDGDQSQIVFSGENDLRLPATYCDATKFNIETYRREKEYIFLSHFFIGRYSANNYGKPVEKTYCSPLLLASAEIGDDNELLIDLSSCRINETLLYSMLEDKADFESAKYSILEISPQESFARLPDILGKFKTLHKVITKERDFSSEKEFKKKYGKIKSTEVYFLPFSACALIPRSISSRGIIDELNTIIDRNDISRSIKSLITNNSNIPPKINTKLNLDYIPGNFSRAQKEIMKLASRSTFSILNGPPGTGKTFTIAAIAIDHFIRGKSVLVVSKNDDALNVIQSKLSHDFGLSSQMMVRGGTKTYHRELKQHVDKILATPALLPDISRLKKNIVRNNRKVSKLEKNIEKRFIRAEKDGKFLSSICDNGASTSIISNFKHWRLQRRAKKDLLLSIELQNLQQLILQKDKLLSHYIDRIADANIASVVLKNRNSLKKFRKAIAAKTSKKQRDIFNSIDFSILLKGMPVWMCSLEGLYRSLPLKKEMFDIVILDEATQCDIASCIPAMYRAKRVLISGDPAQLRHISFLSQNVEDSIKSKLSINELEFSYRNDSILDLALLQDSAANHQVQLDEHFRSTPSLISFSNQHFYHSSLRVMTEKPTTAVENNITIKYVDEGKRENKVNIKESEAVLETLLNIVEKQKDIPDDLKLSIGILCFFRQQSDYIQKLIFNHLEFSDIKKHNIRCATPHSFQGDERDIMLLSCAVDVNSIAGTYTYINKPDVFNVSITRAREQKIVFLSCAVTDLPENSLLYQYLKFAVERSKTPNNYLPQLKQRHTDIMDFSQAMEKLHLKVLFNYPIAGVEMDLVLMDDDIAFAIDLIGFAGEELDAFHLDRFKLFERAGLYIFPVSLTGWRLKREQVLKKISETIDSLRLEATDRRMTPDAREKHWTKLLASSPDIAQRVRETESKLMSVGLVDDLAQLGKLVDQFHNLIWILGERLNTQELTYIRHMNLAEFVVTGALTNWDEICLLSKNYNIENNTEENTFEKSNGQNILLAKIQELREENEKAIKSIHELVNQWALTNTNIQAVVDLTHATDELKTISAGVHRYMEE